MKVQTELDWKPKFAGHVRLDPTKTGPGVLSGVFKYWQNNVKVNSSCIVIMSTYSLHSRTQIMYLANEAKVTIFFSLVSTCYVVVQGTCHLKPGLPTKILSTNFTENLSIILS